MVYRALHKFSSLRRTLTDSAILVLGWKRSSLIIASNVCHSIGIFWMQCWTENPNCFIFWENNVNYYYYYYYYYNVIFTHRNSRLKGRKSNLNLFASLWLSTSRLHLWKKKPGWSKILKHVCYSQTQGSNNTRQKKPIWFICHLWSYH